LVANSGDQVQVELEETGPHTGEFKAAIPAAELPAGASATDSAIDHNPLMAIDHSTESFWQSEPNGETPKQLTVDMKHLFEVSRVRLDTPNAVENAPVRGVVQGSEDGVYWFNLAAHPAITRAEPVAEAFGPMTQRVYAGDHTAIKTWQQVASLARTGKPASEGAAVDLKWSLAKEEKGADQPHAVIWHGKLVQPDSAAMRFSLEGTVTALAVNGRLELVPGEGGRTVDVWLEKGRHDIAIFAATKTGQAGVAVTRARSERSGANVTLVPFNEDDFDLEKAKKALPSVAPVGKQAMVIQSKSEQFAFTKKTEKFGLLDGAKPEDPKVVGNWAALEDKLQWKFNAAQSGVYEVWLDLAHNGGGSRYRVQFADQVIEAVTPNTGNWTTYQKVKVGAVHIDALGEKALDIAPVEIAADGLMVLSGVELRPARTESVILRDREWEFFFDPVELRYVRFQVEEYLGDSVAVNHVEVRGPENAPIIPTKEDVSLLATNETLEIAGGDVITASYTDETAVVTRGGSRLLTAELTATYHDAQVVPVTFEFARDGGGAVQQTRKELLRVDAGERITFEVVDYDMDQTDERDKVTVQVLRNGVAWKELTATETEEYSGVFIAEVETTDKEEADKLLVEPGDRVECVYLDAQNTFPGHEKERKGMVMGNEPTEGAIRIIGTQLRQPPPESEAKPSTVYLPAPEGALLEDHRVGVSYFVPLTVEVMDPDKAKDSQSTVKILLNAGTTNEVEVTCVLSMQFGEFAPNESDNRQGDPALWMGRFIGQVKMQLGGVGSAPQMPRVLGESMSTVGRARPAPKKGEEDEEEKESAPNDNLLITVLNLTGKDTITAKYHDEVRPVEGKVDLESRGRLVTDGAIAITDEGYDEKVEQLHVGEKLFVVVTDPDLDTSDERDKATVVIKSESGEEEEVGLEETLSHSGVFTGSFDLKAKEKPEAKNFNPETLLIECFFGDKLSVNYHDEMAGTEEGFAELLEEMSVAIGTDGLVAAFSKIFGNQQLAVETQFHIAESYFELFKNNRKLERKKETAQALKSGRRVLEEIMVDFPDPKYLPRIAYLSGQFSQELKDWNAAANSYQIIVRQHPNHTLASDAQYKLAHCYEEAGEFDRALEEYVTLAATYPKSPLIPKTMVRINDYFYKRENYVVAAKVAEKFMDRFGDDELASRMGFRWGQCYFKADQFAKAAEVFDLFAKKFPDDPLCSEALFWAGESYRSANNVAFAFRRYNACRWDHPESEAAKYARGRLSLPEMLTQFEAEANSLDDDN
ncbi:MAG: tetratricopeptide repeat protein, partial [Verrucomicrobiota bacterium]|nr:tetratricopeptide repeat protein [Verrucomicrobiota bacterium]